VPTNSGDGMTGNQLRVFIVCRRFVCLKKRIESNEIVRVYDNKEAALADIESKESKNDFNFYIVTKMVRSNAPRN
jgi:hypothetical protein